MLKFRRGSRDRQAARALYEAIVEQARREEFYAHAGVPDTVDGRFELICLHAFLVLRRLKSDKSAADVAQALFDTMFVDMDRNLREMGAGDLGVARRVKAMAKAFYGRIAAYGSALDEGRERLRDVLTNNLYGTVRPEPMHVAWLAEYLGRESASLDRADVAGLAAGRVTFGPPPQGRAEKSGGVAKGGLG